MFKLGVQEANIEISLGIAFGVSVVKIKVTVTKNRKSVFAQ